MHDNNTLSLFWTVTTSSHFILGRLNPFFKLNSAFEVNQKIQSKSINSSKIHSHCKKISSVEGFQG